MRVGQAWDDCPGCGYSESKRSSAAVHRQQWRTAEELADPLRARVEESLEEAEVEGERSAEAWGFTALDPPRELTAERRALQGVMLLSALFVVSIARADRHSSHTALAHLSIWMWGALGYCLLSLFVSEFVLSSGFLGLRKAAVWYGLAVAAVAGYLLLTDATPLALAVSRYIVDPSWGTGWIAVQALWGLWLASLVARELRAMRG